jgi:hypothetical protein
LRQGPSSVEGSVSVARSCTSREAEEEAEEDVLLDFPELLVFSDFDPLPDLPHSSDIDKPLLIEDSVKVTVEALLPPALLFPDLLVEEDILLDFPELMVFFDLDPLPDLPHGSGSNFEPLLFED